MSKEDITSEFESDAKPRRRASWLDRMQSRYIWTSFGLLSALILLFQTQTEFQALETLDRLWYVAKQSYQRQGYGIAKNYRPSPRVQLLQLPYADPTDFWFDEETKELLAKTIENYQGPVVLRFNPARLQKDPILNSILSKSNVIRPFRFDVPPVLVGFEESKKIEEMISQSIEFPNAFKRLSQRPWIVPQNEKYFSEGKWHGNTRTSLDGNLNTVMHFPLVSPGAFRQTPSVALPALTMIAKCESYFWRFDGALELKQCSERGDRVLRLEANLPLFFYRHALTEVNWEEFTAGRIQNQEAILIVDINDESMKFVNAFGNRLSWAEVVGTALNNVIQRHSPWRAPWFPWAELAIAVLLIAAFYLISLRLRFEMTLGFVLLGIISAIAFDFIATMLWNIRTQPTEEILMIVIAGALAIATRAVSEWKHRSFMEEAFRAYMGDQRLRRIMTANQPLKLQRRKEMLTTLFLDISKSTQLLKGLSLDAASGVMDRFFKIVDPILFAHGGWIDKTMGDGFLAVFGDAEDGVRPEQTAWRAMSSALKIQSQLKRSQEEIDAPMELKVRIGVNTGLVEIGNFGSEHHIDYSVSGDAVIVSKRLEEGCVPGEILVGEATYNFGKGRYDFEPREVRVKNESKVLKAFLLKGKIQEDTSDDSKLEIKRLSKPFEDENTISKIRKFLKRPQSSGGAES